MATKEIIMTTTDTIDTFGPKPQWRPTRFEVPRANCSAKSLVAAMEKHCWRLKHWWLHLNEVHRNTKNTETRRHTEAAADAAWDRYAEFKETLLHTARVTKVGLISGDWEEAHRREL